MENENGNEVTESGYVRKSKRRENKVEVHLSQKEKLSIGKRISERLEMHFEEDDAKTRFQYYPRWQEISNLPDGGIDHENPIVALEWVLCDRRILNLLGRGQVEEALALFPNDEMRR